MKTYLDCIPCLIQQALNTVRIITPDESKQQELLREVLKIASAFDDNSTPPAAAQKIHRFLRQQTGKEDPYAEIKRRSNETAKHLAALIPEHLDMPEDEFEAAVRLAIAGNIIDFGAKSNVSDEEIQKTVNDSLTAEIDGAGIDRLKQQTLKCERILYLADNAGEIFFDRFLIEQLPASKTTVAVRGKPVINDVTYQDAEFAGITDLVEVIDNGSDAPGTILEDCSKGFLDRFNRADLIIAKGQGNFETLNDVDKNIFFLFKVKCRMVANKTNHPIGRLVIQQSEYNTRK